MLDAKNEAIARLAYDYWETEGRPNGRAMDHWLRAENAVTELSLKEIARKTKKLKRDVRSRADPNTRSRTQSVPAPKLDRKS